MGKSHKQITARIKVPRFWDRDTCKRVLDGIQHVECVSVKLPAKPGSGAAKGGAWEREFAKRLSLWWTCDKDPHVFARRSGSGGAGRDKSGSSGHAGDIFADKPEGKLFTDEFSVELKFYGDLTGALWALFVHDETKQLRDFWEQARNAAEAYGRGTMLILKTNGRDPIMITDSEWVGNATGALPRRLSGEPVEVCTVSDFFREIKPDDFDGGSFIEGDN